MGPFYIRKIYTKVCDGQQRIEVTVIKYCS